jgi:DNA-binding LytR/AlgR family response regulator
VLQRPFVAVEFLFFHDLRNQAARDAVIPGDLGQTATASPVLQHTLPIHLSRTTADANAFQFARRMPARTRSMIRLRSSSAIAEIDWIAAAGDYAELHCAGHCHLLRETMVALEQKLDPMQFLRIHRSRIVRVACVRELCPIDNREYLVKLSDGSEHRSSRTYAERLDEWLSSGRQ